jgi:uncharacterized protein (TIGR04255 family)
MAKRKQYKNPPLVEVFSEFFFQPPEGEEWDPFVAPSFYRRIEKKFPTRQRVPGGGIEIRVASSGAAPEFQRFGPPTPRYRFISEDGKTLVQLGENLLAVNQLPPYYGWERYEPVVMESCTLYEKLWKPATLARAAVHYIDKVDLPEVEVALDRYFNLFPVLPEGIEQPVTNLTVACEIPGVNTGDILVLTMKQQPSANPDGTAFLFQWDYVATGGLTLNVTAVREWLNAAHDFLSRLFLSTFTEECRKLFD